MHKVGNFETYQHFLYACLSKYKWSYSDKKFAYSGKNIFKYIYKCFPSQFRKEKWKRKSWKISYNIYVLLLYI